MAKTKKKPVKKPVKKAKAAKPNKADQAGVYLLLDRSGSMGDQWSEAITAINTYVAGLEESAVEVTLAAFDHYNGTQFDIVRDAVSPKDWGNLSPTDIRPRGTTPLYDAIAKLCHKAGEINHKRSMLVVMTDGHENASVETTRDRAKKLLDDARGKGWDVIFLGANFDAMPQAAILGSGANKTLNITPQAMAATMSDLANKSMSYVTRGEFVGFNASDRARARGAS